MRKRKRPVTMEDVTEGADDVRVDVLGDGPSDDEFVHSVLGLFRPNDEFDRKREEANADLIELLAQFLSDHPAQRFGQALNNLGLLDNAPNAEPTDQLKRAKKILRRMKR